MVWTASVASSGGGGAAAAPAIDDYFLEMGVFDMNTALELPAAEKGHAYKVEYNGAEEDSGTAVYGLAIDPDQGDWLVCAADGTPAGTGANWNIVGGGASPGEILTRTDALISGHTTITSMQAAIAVLQGRDDYVLDQSPDFNLDAMVEGTNVLPSSHKGHRYWFVGTKTGITLGTGQEFAAGDAIVCLVDNTPINTPANWKVEKAGTAATGGGNLVWTTGQQTVLPLQNVSGGTAAIPAAAVPAKFLVGFVQFSPQQATEGMVTTRLRTFGTTNHFDFSIFAGGFNYFKIPFLIPHDGVSSTMTYVMTGGNATNRRMSIFLTGWGILA